MKCFYHSLDLDGHCSGAIVKHKYPECEMIGIDYGQKFPWDTIKPNEVVYMVDFCLQPFEDMNRLNSMCELIWIDHHKGSIEESLKYLINQDTGISGKRVVGKAGCELTWEYLHPLTELPLAVYLLGRYDVWDHQHPLVLPFQSGMKTYDTNPNDIEFWRPFLELDEYDSSIANCIDPVVWRGAAVLEYIKESNRKIIESHSFPVHFAGLNCIALNKPFSNSQTFNSVWDKGKYDAMIAFSFAKDYWKVSLYTDRDDVDILSVCKAYGGGGHKQACGFTCKDLPIDLSGGHL